MGYTIKTNLSRKENYGGKRNTANIKYIVIHYTANDGDSDESNAKYFKNIVVKASAHYFVDDDSVTLSVPEDSIAFSVGGAKYSDCARTGGGTLYGKATNSNSISIEMCDTKRDGTIKASNATIANTVELCKSLMKKYNIDVDHVIRHFDVNGKHCPAYFMKADEWAKFKALLVSTEDNKVNSVPKATEPKEVSATKSEKDYKVRVTISDLNIRTNPGKKNKSVGFINPGVYTIIETSSGEGSKKGWGKLKSGLGWISLDFADKV